MPDGGEVQLVDVALAADGVEQRVALRLLLALEVGDDGAVGHLFDAPPLRSGAW
jgi:hypothetical protein